MSELKLERVLYTETQVATLGYFENGIQLKLCETNSAKTFALELTSDQALQFAAQIENFVMDNYKMG